MTAPDAIVIGSGPNGLSAAIELSRAGLKVVVYEAAETLGGGTRTLPLTLPGFVHDVCSAIHPLAVSSPFFRTLPLADHGLEWIQPDFPVAHPFDDGTATVIERSLDATVRRLGVDGDAWRELFRPIASRWDDLLADALRPLRAPRHPLMLARFGLRALRSARGLAKARFETDRARALFAGCAAHAMLPLDAIPSAAFGVVLAASAHAVGWPLARGGSGRISEALAGVLRGLGGEIVLGRRVLSLDELPGSRLILADVTPRQLLQIAGARLPRRYREALGRYRYGPGAFKVDFALSGPIPWSAPECRRAGTIHVGGGLDELVESERAPVERRIARAPFVLVTQPTVFDPSRAPPGRHIAWAYCHVPSGSEVDMTRAIEDQIERFAPGFRDLVVARASRGPPELERDNPNLVGGDINGGLQDLRQLFTRPTARLYTTPSKGLFLCSASTPPGGAVHGLCGYYAARAALHSLGRGRAARRR